jgi:hypothetical protein
MNFVVFWAELVKLIQPFVLLHDLKAGGLRLLWKPCFASTFFSYISACLTQPWKRHCTTFGFTTSLLIMTPVWVDCR